MSAGAIRSQWRPVAGGLLFISLLAVGYTTPWDSYLVRERIWWYGADRVLGTAFQVPYEEYAFFILQTLLMGLVACFALHRSGALHPAAAPPAGRRIRQWGTALFLLLGLVGVLALQFERGRYLGLILAWASPILALIWFVGGARLWVLRATLFPAMALVTCYLWVADRVAIGMGIWTISDRYTVGWAPLGLPVEEALFFVVTNLMVTLGLVLFVIEAKGLHIAGSPATSGRSLHADANPI
jgi:lycopene cyclase domain-containing protein